jgi:hypothetical protein
MVLPHDHRQHIAFARFSSATCLAIPFPAWFASLAIQAKRPAWNGKNKPPSGLQNENRACLGRFRPADANLTLAGSQKAQNLPWIDRMPRYQNSDRVGATVVQVPGLDHIDLSRIQKSLPVLGHVVSD